MGKKIALLTLAVMALLSCENPIQSGLGPKVDITVPVISMDNPRNVGDHVKGEFDLKINAQDDIGVTKVQVAVTKDTEGNLLPEDAWEWKDAVFDEDSERWTYPLNTAEYPDGDLPVMIRAEDATGKTVTFEGMYSSKNKPPEVDLQIPALPEDPERRMELVTGGVMIGIAKDLWGVAPGYPKIQFWPASEGEDPADPSVWQDMDSYAARSAAEWAASPSGRTALEFQFHAVDRSKSEPGAPVEDMPGLEPGTYRFRFQITDVDETSALTLYPEEGGYFELDVIAVREFPVITVTAKAANDAPLEGQYHRDPFYIAADVSHTTGIYEARLEVQKEGDEKGSVLAREIYTGNKQTGSEANTTMTRQLASYLINPGQDYEHTDIDESDSDYGAVASYPFTDGIYTFTIYATSYQTSYARQTLAVYIDTKAPEISVTRVQPAVEALNPGDSGLDEYTVNGFIAVDMSAYDENNIGSYVPNPAAAPNLSYREIKYLIRDDVYSGPADDPAKLHEELQALYKGAQYFDNPAAPVYKKPGSTAQVIIDTTHSSITPGGAAFYTSRNKYLHFIAKDRAGNYGYTAALLKVDQSTDIPEITITNFDFAQRSPALLAAAAEPNSLQDANRVLSGTFTDDDGVLIGDTPGDNIKFVIYKDDETENNVPKPIEAKITIDKLDVRNDGKIVNFSIRLPPAPETAGGLSDATHLADGTYSVEIEVKDDSSPGKKNALKQTSMPTLKEEKFNTTDIDTATPKRHIYFVLDTQPPVLTETEVGDTTSAPKLVAGKFSLAGTLSDVNGLRSLQIIQTEEGVENSAKTVFNEPDYKASKLENWEVPDLPVIDGVLKPGRFTYQITARDMAQWPTNLTRRVVVDTEPPDLTITQPAENVWIHNSTVAVKGTETDHDGTGPVFYRIEKVPPTDPNAPQFKDALEEYRDKKDTDGKIDPSGWKELAVLGEEWSDSVDFQTSALGEGNFYLYVAAFDAAGNQTNNETSIRSFGVDYSVPYIKNWNPTGVVEINESYYAKGNYTLSFDAYDSNGLAGVEVIRTLGGTTATLSEGSGSGYTLTINKTDPKTWPVTLALTSPAEGNAAYEFIITDVSGSSNTLDNLPGADADMHKRITVRTDTQPPSLSVAEPINGQSIAGSPLQSSGNATDTGIPEKVEVYYAVTNGTETVTAPATRAGAAVTGSGWELATADASWNASIDLDTPVTEGEKRIHFVAYDQLDNHNAIPVSRLFYVDVAAPHIKTWTSTDIATYSSSNLIPKRDFSFTFEAYDSNALQSVVITRDDLPLTVDGSEHSDAAGSYTITRTPIDDQNWTYAASFTGQIDGNYVYGIEITDIAGKTNLDDNAPEDTKRYKTFNVRIDTVGPVLVFNEPADDSTVSGSTITIGGTASDALTPAGVTVWYVIDGNDAIGAPSSPPSGSPPALAGWDQADGSADWYKNAVIPTGGDEGHRYVHVVAYDQLGNQSNIAHKPFYVDISPPVIDSFSFTNVTPDAGVNFAREGYGFTFKAKDTNALQSVKVSRDGTELITATGAVSSGTGNGYAYTVTVGEDSAKEWTVTVNLTGQDDGNYNFNIEVKDIAGRENALDNNTPNNATDDRKTFGVRVDTTGPVVTIVDPATNMAASGNRLYIGGTAPDTDDLTSDGITAYYKIDSAPGTLAPADKDAAVSDWTEAPGGAFWSHNAVLDSSEEEGERWLHVIAYDKLGNPSNVEHRKFFVDVNPPQILAWDNSPSMGINFSSTPYYAGKDYTIKFSAFDTNTLAGGNPLDSQSLVTITRNGVPLTEGSQSGYTLTINRDDPQTWPVTLALTNQADGNYSYSIEIRDATGKENALDNSTTTDPTDDHKSFTIVVDRTPPNTSLTMAPATVSNEGQDFVLTDPTKFRSDNVNGIIEFAASAMDPSGLEGVKWFIIPDSPSPAFNLSATTAKDLYEDSRGTLFAENSYTALYDTTDPAALDRKHYSLYILAKDKAGNVGYNSATSFGFYIDQRTDRPVATLTNLTKDGDDDPVAGNSFLLRGTVKDDDGVDKDSLAINLFDGLNWYTGSGWDSNDPVDLPIPAGSVTGSGREVGFSYEFPAMVDGPNHRVVVKAADLKSSKTGSGNGAYDPANAEKTGSVETSFVLDITSPVITVVEPNDSTYKAEAAGISGTLTEMNIDVFRLRIDAGDYSNYIENDNPDAGPLVLTSWDSASGVGTWTYQLPIMGPPLLTVGLHTITLEAVDKAGLSTTVLWRFYVDNTGPVISFRIDEVAYPTWGTVPAGMNILREGGLALRGDFRDDFSAVFTESFEYRFDDHDQETDWITTNSTTASIANPGRNPSWTLFLENLPDPIGGVMPDGSHRVQIRVKDALGNTATSAWIGFRVDTADPTIINIQPPEADAVFGGTADPAFTLTGKATDANLSSITLTLNGGVATPIIVPAGATSVDFSHPVTSTVFGGLGQGSHRFTITAVDEAGRSRTVEWNFIKDTNPPTIEWSNLNNQTGDNSTMFQDTANLKIIGIARDTNGVRTLTSSIDKWNGTDWDVVDTNIDLAPGDEAVKNWIRDVATLGVNPLDGRYRITINATDRGGNAVPSQTREFRIDLALPTVAIDEDSGARPLKRFYNGKGTVESPSGSGPIAVSGTASDANGITGVTAKLSGTNAPAWAAATATYTPATGIWQVTIPHENPGNTAEKLPQGSYTLNVIATDGAGRENTAYGTFTFDSVDPTSTIDLPVNYGRVTGSVAIRGSNNDTNGVAKMEYQFTRTDTVPNNWREALVNTTEWSGGLYSWNFTFTASNYFTADYGREVEYNAYNGTVTAKADTGLWEVPFKIKVIDQAGNEKIIDDYFLLLDAKGDIPRIEISTPASGSILGGRVYITGTANDNHYINRVQYRVKSNPTGLNDWAGIEWQDGTNGFLTGSGIGPSVTWQFDINGDGSLNPDAGEGMRPALIQVRAIDAPQGLPNDPNGAPSDPVSVLIYFDAGVPRISGERVANRVAGPIPWETSMGSGNSVAYVDGLQVSKKFVFEASIQDDSGLETIQYWKDGILAGANALGTDEVIAPDVVAAGYFKTGYKYMIKDVGEGTDWIFLGSNSPTHGATFTATGPGSGTGTAYEATAAGEFVYKLRFMIPSDELPAYTDKTGHFTINIMALDNSSPQLRADRSYTLQVDNFYPSGAYTSANVAAGNFYYIQGAARDFDATSGPIQGLDKVVVYFSRAGSFIPLDEASGAHSWVGTPQDQEVRSMVNPSNPVLTTVPFPVELSTEGLPRTEYSGIFINWDETGVGADVDGDGYVEGWYDNGADKVWSAQFDTRKLKDGPVTVHYVVFDRAGNASYYEQTVFIKNHAPVIKSVTLGTDIFGNKGINGTRLYTTGYFTNPAFVARNQRLAFNVAKLDGNNAVHYRITPVEQAPVNTIVAGEIYTIKTPGATDWVAIGAANNLEGTTFVATASRDSVTGEAFKYNPVSGAVIKTGNMPSAGLGNETGIIEDTTFSGADFANILDKDKVYFLIKVWDSTVSGTWTDPLVEAQQLSDQIVVRVKIENTDWELPTSRLYDLSPHAKNQSKYDIVTNLTNVTPDGIGEDKNMRYGGLYMNDNAISGHVEPRSNSIFLEEGVPSTFAKDTVSGKVILRGYARDNQRISGIQLKFGAATPITIIQVSPSLTGISGLEGHFRALTPLSGAWVYDDLSLDEHLVEWAYEWDTQTTDGMAVVGDITVQAISRDAKILSAGYADTPYTLTPNPSASVDQSTNNVTYNTIGMTAAPYITSLERGRYNTLRSKQGWISFRRSSGTETLEANEEVIVNGFNLSLSDNTGAAVTLPGVSDATTAPGLTSQDRNKLRFNLPTDNVKSGAFGLTVNSIPAVNNLNDNRNTWNKEASATVEGSALWNDDRNVHVWQTNNANTNANRGYFTGSEKPIHPAMTKHPTTGVLHASWSNYAASSLYRGTNNAGSTQTFKGYDPPEHTDIHFGNTGANTSPTIAYNQNYWADTSWNNLNTLGGMAVYDESAENVYVYVQNQVTGKAYMAESLWHDKILAQFENPRVVAKGDAIHISYYDTDTKSLKYWYNTRGVNVRYSSGNGRQSPYYDANTNITLGENTYANNRWINIDGGFDGHDRYGQNRVLGYITGGTAGNGTSAAVNFSGATYRDAANGDVGSSSMAGEFSAIDLTSQGYPVIAYYDITNQTVKLAYSQSTIPLVTTSQSAPTQWKRQNVLASSDPNYTFSGRYISMRIDTRSGMQNRIHMVFYRTSSGDLIYVTGTQGGDGSYTFEPSVVIDSVGNVGKWADLSLDAHGNPWVSYADSSWFDSFDAVKMAYCASTSGFVGVTALQNPDSWEVMTMPTIYNVADKRLSIENWDNTNQQFWSAAIGYAADDYFRIGYYIKP